LTKKSKIPLEYFLPLLKANSDGEIVGARKLPTQTAHALHALQISEEQLKELQVQHLEHMRLLHEHKFKDDQLTKKKSQTRVRKARSRQADYPDNLEKQQKRSEQLDAHVQLHTKAYPIQEQQAQHWVPPFYKNGRFDVEALGQTLRSQLPGLIPSVVSEIAWADQNGQFIPAPSTPKLSLKKLKKDENFRALVMDLYEAFFYWCPPQRKEAEVFAKKLSPLQHAMRLRYNTAAEDFTVAVINHAVSNVRYTTSDLRYIYPRERLTEKQRRPLPKPKQFPTNTPSEDLEEIRRKTYEASLLGPIG